MKNLNLVGYAIGFLLLLAAPFMFYPVLVMKVLCYALFACAFNLLLGYTGLLSFGHAAFFGTAAYVAGHAIQTWGFPPVMGLLAGTAAAAELGYVYGALAIRRQGIYFAMVTLALAQMIFFYFLQAAFTGGENGLQGVPRGTLFGLDLSSDMVMYYFVVAVFVLGFWLIYRTIHSPFGQVLKAIRENEPRAVSLGYDVAKYKLVAFVLSAALAGLAGALKMLVFHFATLEDARWQTSGEVVLMTLLGGMGTPFGPVVGAAIVVLLQDKLPEEWAPMVTVITGAIFVVCVLVFRRGIVGEIAALVRRFASKRTQP